MAKSWNLVCFSVVFLLIFTCLAVYIVSNLAGNYRAVFIRCTLITVNNAFVILCSCYAWLRVSKFVHQIRSPNVKIKQDNKQNETKRNSTIGKCLYFSFVLFAILSWYTPYIAIFRPTKTTHWVPFTSYLCLGFLLQFMLCIFLINGLKWMRRLYNKYISQDVRMQKVYHLDRSQALDVPIAVTYALLCCMYGLHCTSLPQEIVSVEIPIVGLPKSFDGYRIAQMSDIHLGPTVGRERLEQVVNIVNTINADAAVIVGDLVDGPVQRLGDIASVLKDIRVKGGKYFVSGNHEYYSSDVDEWFMFLRSLGFVVLHNEHVKIQEVVSQEFFYLAGTDDLQATKLGYTGHGFDLDKAVKSCEAERPIILLAHQPNAARKALDSAYNIKLVLSGHTHGGQMFPFTLIVGLVNSFRKGLYEYKNGHVYVSQGTMYWGIPFRIGTFMEITEITLRSKEFCSRLYKCAWEMVRRLENKPLTQAHRQFLFMDTSDQCAQYMYMGMVAIISHSIPMGRI